MGERARGERFVCRLTLLRGRVVARLEELLRLGERLHPRREELTVYQVELRREALVPKALVEADGDRILGFTGFGVGAGEILSSVQIAMLAGLPYTALRDAILTHPTLGEGLIPLFSSAPSAKELRS